MSIETVAKLKALKLHGMASSWPELVARARHAEFDPERVGEAIILRQLPLMKNLDPVAREFERVNRFGVRSGRRNGGNNHSR